MQRFAYQPTRDRVRDASGVLYIKKHILILISQQCIVYKYSCQFKASKPQTTNIEAQADDKRSKSNPSLGCQP